MTIDNLKFRASGKKVVIEGHAAPNATVKLENLSAAPFHAGWHDDAFVSAKADAKGNFKLVLKGGVEGDKVRLSLAGAASQVVTVTGVGTDNRRAEFNVQALRLSPNASGGYSIGTVSVDDVVGEPGARILFKNQRTGQTQNATLDKDGRFPSSLSVAGEPGDVITLAATDGRVNKSFQDTCGNLVVPPRRNPAGVQAAFEPAPSFEDKGITSAKLDGQLFVGGASPTDPSQGGIGDCYLVSSASALALNCPEVLQKLIKDNGNGTYTVTFKRYDAKSKSYKDDPVTVSNSFPMKGSDTLYAAAPRTNGTRELWFPVLEKAYAAWKGGYDAIRSGYPYEIFEACLGAPGKHFDPRVEDSSKIFASVQKALQAKKPVVVWTGVESAERSYTNTGLVADHAYTVLGVSVKDGQRVVELRNPWGCTEPRGNGVDDGVFTMPWKDFVKLYDGVGIAS